MLTTRRLFAAAALAGLAAACARPIPFDPMGVAADLGPLQLRAENVAIDVSGLTEAEAVGAALALFRDDLAIDEDGGRPVRAVVNVHDFDIVDSIVSSLTGSHSALEGEVALNDLNTGERIFVTERIRVDARSLAISESGVFSRDRATAKTDKLSKLFMQRARQALVASDT